ncbi:OPT/YSL family transporter [Actinoalloteichus sp. AHMU CJ021]|uniref:OPT/YSL family transporter n=1 Tax=Actinoalloteichus sp. AHMU CJ021 TaxID=2072503 RepID=UPI0026A332F3
MSRTRSTPARPLHHPTVFEPLTFVLIVALSAFGALIGLHLITTLGISANTSVIGALLAMLLGRVSILGLSKMRSIHRQNLTQSAISAATFAAANALLTPIAIPFAFGRPDLVWPMLIGSAAGLMIDIWVLYRAFDSAFLPATGTWPPGVAAAETILAGDRGGRRALILAGGAVVGVVGAFAGLAMSAAGVALIGNMWALLMFGVGLFVNQYGPGLFDVDLTALYIPHGVMIGAGLVALGQAIHLLVGRRSAKAAARAAATASKAGQPAVEEVEPGRPTVDPARLRRAFGEGFALFVLGAVLLAVLSGLWADMSPMALIGWVLFAGFAALVHEIIVGLAAMHAGWFPAFAVTLIFLVFGLLVGIPTVPLVLLTAYTATTGPAFADMGYDLKAGWMLRREEQNTAFELAGRRQQYLASAIGCLVALGMVALLWRSFLEGGSIPPVATVYADTIKAGLGADGVLTNMLIWAVPGALIQLIGGSRRQMGVLLATGLLVGSVNACWLVFAALLGRVIYRRVRGAAADQELSLVGAGLIAGDSVAATAQVLRS